MHPIKPKGLSRGLDFQFFEYFGFWVWVFCKSLTNFELDDLKFEKKILIFGYGFEYQLLIFFDFFKLFKSKN